MQVCALGHWLFVSHGERHCWSDAQSREFGQGCVALHATSCGNSQIPSAPDTTQCSAGLVAGQSLETLHAAWHRPNAQTSGDSQSLLMEQPAASDACDELHPGIDSAAPVKNTTPKTKFFTRPL